MQYFFTKFFYIIIAVLILLLMITIHEFGHYIAGKILGFKIDEFSIGFGPKLFSKKKKNGEVFSVRLLPLGGFCAFAGESDEEKILAPEKKSDDVFDIDGTDANSTDKPENASQGNAGPEVIAAEGDAERNQTTEIDVTSQDGKKSKKERATTDKKFNEQPPWKRIIVLLAGGVFNILSAVVFSFIFIAVAGADTANVVNVYDSVDTSVECQLLAGDEIVEIDGKKINICHNVTEALAGKKEGDQVKVVVIRDGERVTVTTTVRKYVTEDVKDDKYPVGLGIGTNYNKASVGDAFVYCVPYTAKLSWLILGTFGDLIAGKVPISEVSGPIGTVNQMANYGMQNWAYLLVLMPLIAANLGIFNLFPIPALDGAKVVFTVVEWIRGKPINQKVETMIHFIGLVVLLGLVIVLDVIHLVGLA